MERTTSRSSRAAVCGVLCMAVLLVASGSAPDDQVGRDAPSLPDDIRQALERNAAALSPVAISWETRYRSALPTAEAVRVGQFPEKSGIFDPRLVEFSRQDGKYSYFRKFQGTRKGAKFLNRFDGRNLYQGSGLDAPDETPVVMIYGPEKLNEKPRFVFESEYFERAGFKLFGTTDALKKPDESFIFYLIGLGAKLKQVALKPLDGSYCWRVDLTSQWGFHKFYLDSTMNYALRRYVEETLEGRTKRVTTNSRFVEYGHQQIWLPLESRSDWYTWNSMQGHVLDSPLLFEEILVGKVDKSRLSDDTFVIDVKKPGTVVADSRLPGAQKRSGGLVQYEVPANLEYLEGVVDAAVKGKKFTPDVTDNRLAKVFVAANLVIFIAGAFYLWRSKR